MNKGSSMERSLLYDLTGVNISLLIVECGKLQNVLFDRRGFNAKLTKLDDAMSAVSEAFEALKRQHAILLEAEGFDMEKSHASRVKMIKDGTAGDPAKPNYCKRCEAP